VSNAPSTGTDSTRKSADGMFPAPALCLRVGVTANRWRAPGEPDGFRINPAHRATLQQTVSNVFAHIQHAVQLVYHDDANGDYYARVEPVINLISPLAEGGDRLVATVARSLEKPWPIDVIVPCDISARPDRDPYIPLAPLWNAARGHLILDGDQDDDESLIETNRRLLWNCDLLVAIWDNKEGRGEAGTARVVEIAAELGLPVIQIDAEPDATNALLHAYRVLEPAGNVAETRGAAIDIDTVISRLLGPPVGIEHEVHEALRNTAEYAAIFAKGTPADYDAREKKQAKLRVWRFLAAFRRERVNSAFVRVMTGFTWSIAMTILTGGARRVQRVAWRIRGTVSGGYGAPWERVMLAEPAMDSALEEIVSPSYERSDYFATSYATRHRGSTVWMVILAPVAVLFAWLSLTVPESMTEGGAAAHAVSLRIAMVGFEFASLLAILYVYLRALTKGFHARWLDYRLLAERLRHLGFLWPVGRGALVMRVPVQKTPEDPHTAWVNWWYRAVARQLPVPSTTFTRAYLQWYLEFLREQVVKDQQNYLDATYHTAEIAEGRVRNFAKLLFSLAFVGASVHLVLHFGHVEAPEWFDVVLSFVAIVLPGFGAAAHAFGSNLGLPEQALRSASTIRALSVVREGLRDVDTSQPLASIALGDLAQQTANALGDDLFGWRVDYLVRPTPQPG
jgi:hypothetical protein